MTDGRAALIVASIAVLLGGAALYRTETAGPRTVVMTGQPAAPSKASRQAWPGLGQDATIRVGEALQSVANIAGGAAAAHVTIYCDNPDCDALMHDIDDGLQIAGWSSDFERAHVDDESLPGLRIGPPGHPVANALMKALNFMHPLPADMPGPGIIIGKFR